MKKSKFPSFWYQVSLCCSGISWVWSWKKRHSVIYLGPKWWGKCLLWSHWYSVCVSHCETGRCPLDAKPDSGPSKLVVQLEIIGVPNFIVEVKFFASSDGNFQESIIGILIVTIIDIESVLTSLKCTIRHIYSWALDIPSFGNPLQ